MSRNNTPSILSSLTAYDSDSDLDLEEEEVEGGSEGSSGKVQLLLPPPSTGRSGGGGSGPSSREPSPKAPLLHHHQEDEENYEFQPHPQEEEEEDEGQQGHGHDPDADALLDMENKSPTQDIDVDQANNNRSLQGQGGDLAPLEEEDPCPEKRRKLTHHRLIGLPPPVEGSCSPQLEAKFARMLQLKEKGRNANEIIQGMKAFRNPSIYDKLILLCNIQENGTNFPDPPTFAPSSYYDQLLNVQMKEMERRFKEKEKKHGPGAGGGGVKVDFIKGTLLPPPTLVGNPTVHAPPQPGQSQGQSGAGQKPPSTYIKAFGSLAFKN